MWKCECGANNEEESLICTSCGLERGTKEREPAFKGFAEPSFTIPREEVVEPPPRERAFEEVYPPVEEEFLIEEEPGPSIKKIFRIAVLSIMSVLIAIISILAFVQIGGITETAFLPYLRNCIGIWIRCIILTQAVVIIGIVFLYFLSESKPIKF